MTQENETPQLLEQVRQKIDQAALQAGRAPGTVDLCAVSKTFPEEAIRPALEAGHRIFGENRVQEAEVKWPKLKTEYTDVQLHLIGPLQTNKVRKAVDLFDVIQTLDRPKLAKVLADEMERVGRSIPCYIQINTGGEPQKAGVSPKEADAFIRMCQVDHGITVAGLMCIPPQNEEPALHFSLLHDLAVRNGLSGLSMGMSADYEIAVQFGATLVRVGSAIFGARTVPHATAAA